MVDNKFIDPFIESAEKVSPGKNVYLFTFDRPAKVVKYQHGLFVPPFTNELDQLLKTINDNDRVYIHWFEKYLMDIVPRLPSKVTVYLFFWGGDFLGQTNEFVNFNFDLISRSYLNRHQKKLLLYLPRNPIGYIRNINRYFRERRERRINEESEKNARIDFLKRLDYFCHWNRLDFDIVMKSYGGNPDFLDFFYDPSLYKIACPLGNKIELEDDVKILLGNSDVLTNNHLDALNVLKQFSKEKLKLICPLSYDNGEYARHITKKGKQFFADKWLSITEFMSIEKYLVFLDTIDVVVMYHNRTQAAGNIFALLKMGKKVFLKKESTLYAFVIDYGIKVFDANTIKNLSFKEFSKPLAVEEMEMNYSRVSEIFSEDRRLSYLENILN